MITQDEILNLQQKHKNGDETALETLLEEFKPMVKSISRHYFLLDGDEEDLVQEGMIGLYKAIESYSKEKNASFQTFAYVCILRQVQMAVRKSLRNKQNTLNTSLPLSDQGMIVLDDANNSKFFLLSEDLNPEETLLENEQKQELTKKAKAVLSNFEFQVFAMFLKGFSISDIAQKTKKDAKSISNAITRTKEKLKKCFGG